MRKFECVACVPYSLQRGKISLCRFGVFFAFAAAALFVPSLSHSEIAAKSYVENIVMGIKQPVQPDWNQTDTAKLDYIKNKPVIPDISGKADTASLATVAFSGNYKDLQNVPEFGAGYYVLSNFIQNAASGTSFMVNMDGYVFIATKQSTTNYWSLRIRNNTGGQVVLGTRSSQLYATGGNQTTAKETTLGNGSDMNPDTESGDIGYGKEDVFIVRMFDTTNMHLYRVTLAVYVGKAILTVERLA
ncbi:MAG: hypothetical protein LBD50_00210 [Rickettsiales bacterium]|jgi:hypothetical protein|nr:hypothetical protein [Rickettsiales bacterium]